MTTWAEVSRYAGRNDMPHRLVYAVLIDRVLEDPEEIAEGVAQSWTAAEWPQSALDAGIWLTLFNDAVDGDPDLYLHDTEPAPRSDLPEQVTLFRGCGKGTERGMSWTDDRERAEWFAHRFDGRGGDEDRFVLEITVPREVVLARFGVRGEDEWVLDPDALYDLIDAEEPDDE